MRCTILVKLPVALSGGSSEKVEPEAGDTLVDLAFDLMVRQRIDADRRPAGRACSRATCVSLKLASI